MKTVNVHKAKTDLSSMLAQVEAGEEFVISRRNKPVARLVSLVEPTNQERGYRSLAHLRGKVPDSTFSDPLPEEELRAWEGFAEEGKQSALDVKGMAASIDAGTEFIITRDGKPAARVVPISKKPRVPGALAHLRGKMPGDLFLTPMSEDELQAWEGKYSFD